MRVQCVGAVISDGNDRIVVIRRGQPPGQGLWSLPGGRVEPGETHAEAVVREVHEETGLRIAAKGILGVVEVPSTGDVVYAITDYAASVINDDDMHLVAGDDATDARWVGREEFDTLVTSPGLADALDAWDIWQ